MRQRAPRERLATRIHAKHVVRGVVGSSAEALDLTGRGERRRRRSRGGGRAVVRAAVHEPHRRRARQRAAARQRLDDLACRAPATRLCSLRRRPSWQPAREATPRAGETAAHRGREARARKPRAPWARWARTARASSYGHALLPPIVKKACAASTRNPGGKILLALASQPSVSAGKFSARFTVRFSSHESCGGIRGSTDRKSVAKARLPQQHQLHQLVKECCQGELPQQHQLHRLLKELNPCLQRLQKQL